MRRQIPGINCSGLVPPREINKIAVVGGGRMGSGIVTALILSNFRVILKEIDDNFLQEGLDRVQGT